MKTYVHVFLVAACLVACARGLPGARRESIEDSFEDSFPNIDSMFPSFPDVGQMMDRLRESFMNYFWNLPVTHINIPEGANTTSTTKIINGHVVMINETTYSSNDENGGTVFRIRVIDVKPQNDTGVAIEPTTIKAEAPESAETIEDFNNEISKNTDTLTA